LWIGCCWKCRVIFFIVTGGVVVYFVNWMLLDVESYIVYMYRFGGGSFCSLNTSGCVEVHCLYVQFGWWISLWIGSFWLCRITLYIGTGALVV
jgi:hypothetical protein